MTERVPEHLFNESHYLGRPADADDLIIRRRVELARAWEGFCNPQENLLEIGCGNGASLMLLHRDFHACLGVELFPEHEQVFQQLKARYKAEHCNFQQHNIEETPVEGVFSRLISFEVIEHLRSEDAVANYFKSLQPGGMAVFSVPNKWWIFETHGARLPLLPWNRVPFFSWLPRPLHERWANARIYTRKRIVNLLEKHGFHVQSTAYVTAPLDVLKDGALKRFLQRYMFKGNTTRIPFLSTSILVTALRPSSSE
ncbi:MAG: methyltransferase domain-containing protein [Bacteroidetes bacterium]|nr:methyltransferase domain-containing protein [Bacteroidota bacterium]